jgi:hypothetical protein
VLYFGDDAQDMIQVGAKALRLFNINPFGEGFFRFFLDFPQLFRVGGESGFIGDGKIRRKRHRKGASLSQLPQTSKPQTLHSSPECATFMRTFVMVCKVKGFGFF